MVDVAKRLLAPAKLRFRLLVGTSSRVHRVFRDALPGVPRRFGAVLYGEEAEFARFANGNGARDRGVECVVSATSSPGKEKVTMSERKDRVTEVEGKN